MARHDVPGVAQVLICAGCLWTLAGCAVVKTVDADGQEQTRLLPFAMDEASRPSASARQVKITTLGISSRQGEFDVGLRTEDVAILPPECHAVLIVRSEAQAETAAKLARAVNESCVINR